jgi:tripartite-type tricarboxylate transporter receptor subunit TctC
MRILALALATVLALHLAPPANAQSYPNRTVTFVVATTAGGLTDVLVRSIANELRKEWGQPVIVENRPGASTIVGATHVARSAPDGYTILVANDPTLSLNQYLQSNLSYDPVKDFALVLNMVQAPSIMVTEASFPANNIVELIALAKQRPGALNYASFGPNSNIHLDTEAFAQKADIRLTHIPYRGVAEVMTALLGKQIDVSLSGIAPALGPIREGKLKALGIASEARSPVLPNVPTFAESGIGGYDSRGWWGLVVPAGTPRDVIDKIARDTSRVITAPDFVEKNLVQNGFSMLNQGPEEFAKFIDKDREKYSERIRIVKGQN